MIGVPSFVVPWSTRRPDASSTRYRRAVIRTGGLVFVTGGSPSGVGSGVGAGVGVATATGVGVATGTGALGAPPPPQETEVTERNANRVAALKARTST